MGNYVVQIISVVLFCSVFFQPAIMFSGQWKEFKKQTISFANGSSYVVTVSKRMDQDEMLEFKVSVNQPGQSKPLKEFIQQSAYEYGTFHIIKAENQAFIVSEINLGGAHGLNQYAAFFLDDKGKIRYEKEVEDYGYIETSKQKVIFHLDSDKITYQVKNGIISKTKKR